VTDFSNCQDGNSRYLSAALSWLRLRLERMVTCEAVPAQAAKRPGKPVASTELADDDAVALAALSLAEREGFEPPPGALMLSRLLQLSRFERNVLLLCAGMELDTRIAGLCARAQDDPSRPYPTLALAMALFDEPAWDIVSPERPLRFWRLIEVQQVNGQALTMSPLRIDQRILNYLKGLNYLDEGLSALLLPLERPVDADVPPSLQGLVDDVVSRLRQTSDSLMPVIQLLGSDGPGKQKVAQHAAAAFGRLVYRLSIDVLRGPAAEIDTLIRLWHRESLLLPLALFIDVQEYDSAAEGAAQVPLARFLARADGLLFLGSRDFWPRLGRATFTVDVAKPTAAEQEAAWTQFLDDDAGDNPGLLAGQFNLSLTAIRDIAGVVRRSNVAHDDISARLWDACRAGVRPRLDVLAQRIDAKATWSDIVLPTAETGLLRQISAQVGSRGKVYGDWGFGNRMNRGLGISALFAGDSGTGKTMAAEVIANELRLNLYRIDLSAVVSKYIGETEKNLRRLFDAADDGGAILFFDEADALFGRRSEVKDSHDRYANIEVNYLLQRLEAYRGLAILATNMKSALDQAFVRRLRFIVNFSFPGVAERRRMWESVFPAATPLAGLDYDRLARLNLTGGTIHNAALNAAFLAAAAESRVTMELVLSAARTEMLKLDRPVNEGDFQVREAAQITQ
jgi:hypothetical protein